MERFAKIDQRLYAVNYFRKALYLAALWIRLCIYLQLCDTCYQNLKICYEAHADMTSLSKFFNIKQLFFKGVFQTSWYKELL